MNDDTPNSRVYVHKTCGGATTVSGEDFISLADPFSGVSLTVCAACQTTDEISAFAWKDTGENIVDARRRTASELPFLARFVNSYVFYGLWCLACGAIGASIMMRFPSQHISSPWAELIFFFVGVFVGLILYFGFLSRPLTNMLMGPSFDVRKLK